MTLGTLGPQSYCWSDTAENSSANGAGEQLSERSRSASETQSRRLETLMANALVTAGHEDRAVDSVCVIHALRFAQALPANLPTPEIVVEADGSIAFDWDLERRRNLTVTIKASGHAGYAALFGHEPIYGKAPMAGTVPATIAFLLRRLERG